MAGADELAGSDIPRASAADAMVFAVNCPAQVPAPGVKMGLHALLLVGGLAGLRAAIGWVLGGPAGLLWTAVLGGAALVFTPRISPALILRLYQARPLHRAEAPALFEMTS